jgi:hypothetical protein
MHSTPSNLLPCICGAVMLRADGKDITKKASHRKGRYLLVFNFQLAPAAAGKLVRHTCIKSLGLLGSCMLMC